MSFSTEFIYWYYNEFHRDELYRSLCLVSEDSPWHSEHNIGAHTDMVVAQYLMHAGSGLWSKLDLIGAFAAAFHDVGKPTSMERKWSEERGDYKAFHGHELVSARLWEDYAARNWDIMKSRFKFSKDDIYRVGYFIEYHVPFGLKNPEKLRNLASTLFVAFAETYKNSAFDSYKNLLFSDTWGRISDDAVTKREKTITWVQGFWEDYMDQSDLNERALTPRMDIPTLYMPIGASGLGKSTLRKKGYVGMKTFHESDPNRLHYSWDQLRLDWYIQEGEEFEDEKKKYSVAFERSIEDKEFGQKVQKVFIDMVKTGKDIFVDNTNLKKKRRRPLTEEARRHGYTLIAILMPIGLEKLKERQKTRSDKHLYAATVEKQYMSMQLPQYGEFDEIVVLPFNLE